MLVNGVVPLMILTDAYLIVSDYTEFRVLIGVESVGGGEIWLPANKSAGHFYVLLLCQEKPAIGPNPHMLVSKSLLRQMVKPLFSA